MLVWLYECVSVCVCTITILNFVNYEMLVLLLRSSMCLRWGLESDQQTNKIYGIRVIYKREDISDDISLENKLGYCRKKCDGIYLYRHLVNLSSLASCNMKFFQYYSKLIGREPFTPL